MGETFTRLAAIRRIYFYLVALITLIAGLFAVNGLLHGLTVAWAGTGDAVDVGNEAFVRMLLARNGGLLVVTAPLFLLHWGYIQRRFTDADERHAGMRKFFLYAASAAGLAVGLANLQTLSRVLLNTLFAPQSLSASPITWLQQIGMMLVGFGLLGYFYAVLQADGDYGRETGAARLWRRLFLALSGVIGVVMMTLGAAEAVRVLLEMGLERMTPSVGAGWATPLAQDLATLLTGALLTHGAGRQWHSVIAVNVDDATSAWRRLYLYGAVIIGALATLTPAALILREGLLLLFGEDGGSAALLLNKLIEPLAYVPAGVAIWVFYRRTLRREQARFGESAESITVGRVYNYVVAATALVLLWFGAIEILQALIDTGFSSGAVVGMRPVWVQPLATGLSLLAVAAPVWLLHWRTVQTVARRDDAPGADERTSLARRIFLFGLALVSAVLVVVFVAQVIYRVFLLLLGAPDAGLWSAEAANELARAAVSAAIWLFTVTTIRADGRMPAPTPPAMQPHARRRELETRITQLETELQQAREELAALPHGQD